MPYTSKPQTNATKTIGSPISSTVWIGNISPNSSEQEVLDFAASIGKILKFDFMYHDGKAGNLPRGYAFATYCGKIDESAKTQDKYQQITIRQYLILFLNKYVIPFSSVTDYSVATAALRNLNGKLLNGRHISVQPANSNYHSKIDYRNKSVGNKESLKGLSIANEASSSQVSKEDKIRAIEAKLKALEKGEVSC